MDIPAYLPSKSIYRISETKIQHFNNRDRLTRKKILFTQRRGLFIKVFVKTVLFFYLEVARGRQVGSIMAAFQLHYSVTNLLKMKSTSDVHVSGNVESNK